MKFLNRGFKTLLGTIACTLTATQGASALELNLTYDPDITKQEIFAIETAKVYWEEAVKDDISINIHIQMQNSQDFREEGETASDPPILGMAIPAFESNFSLDDLVKQYEKDLAAENPGVAVGTSLVGNQEFCQDGQYGDEYYNNPHHWGGCTNPNFWALRTFKHFTEKEEDRQGDTFISERNIYPHFDLLQKGNAKTNKILATTAQLKALDTWHKKSSAAASRLDGLIVLNRLDDAVNPSTGNKLRWEYWYGGKTTNNTNPFKGDRMNLTTVALHEIGHILGFVSGGDLLDTVEEARNSYTRANQVTTLDFFRRDQEGRINLEYGSAVAHGNAKIPAALYVGGLTRDGFGNVKIFSDLRKENGFVISKLSRGIHLDLYGDGAQISHFNQEITGLDFWNSLNWTDKRYYRENDDLMNPFLFVGWNRGLSATDSIVFDILGYDMDYTGLQDKYHWHFTKQALDRTDEIIKGTNSTSKIVTNPNQLSILDKQIAILMATAADAILGDQPSFDELYDEIYVNPDNQEIENYIEAGFDTRSLLRRTSTRGFRTRRLKRRIARVSGFRNSFLHNDRNSVLTFNEPQPMYNANGNQLLNNEGVPVPDITLRQKGIFLNQAIFASPEQLEREAK